MLRLDLLLRGALHRAHQTATTRAQAFQRLLAESGAFFHSGGGLVATGGDHLADTAVRGRPHRLVLRRKFRLHGAQKRRRQKFLARQRETPRQIAKSA